MEPNHLNTRKNRLSHENSPYLLQHASNPVDWYPWGDEAFQKARREDKLVLVSIGYSACHWCHVMERESFENEEVARFMNDNFVCIKVDREERPDIDQVYMTAVQIMSGQGGWPLNCFALPDGRPVYGGTYYPSHRWLEVLDALASGYAQNKNKFLEYASELSEGVISAETVVPNYSDKAFQENLPEEMTNKWKHSFDLKWGGSQRAPKFPMPSNYDFLLRYGVMYNDKDILKHVELTLDKMALGGIYDQIGGGFARYSTDAQWKVPHFEKMLYDNAQLICLYARAYRHYKHPLYLRVVQQTIEFIYREFESANGLIYSALDADSEGEEGKYYLWTSDQIAQTLTASDAFMAKKIYSIDKEGAWEHGKNILLMPTHPREYAAEEGVSEDEVYRQLDKINRDLLKTREKRIRPGLDDKTLTSWNAMMVTALCEAYYATADKKMRYRAEKLYASILSSRQQPDGSLLHSGKNNKAYITGFLEDYAFMLQATLSLYSATGNTALLTNADAIARYTIEYFEDKSTGLFYFTSIDGEALFARKMEITDNVIPSGNSIMADNFLTLGHLTQNTNYLDRAAQMLHQIQQDMPVYPQGYSQWANVYLAQVKPFYEVVVTGPDAEVDALALRQNLIPQGIVCFNSDKTDLPLFAQRESTTQTRFFICVNNSCLAPVNTFEEALKLLRY